MSEQQDIILSPVQETALNGVLDGLSKGGVLLLKGRAGSGKTTILYELHRIGGGELLGMKEFIQSLAARQLQAIEEALVDLIAEALMRSEIVIIDDLHLVNQIVSRYDYDRMFLIDAALTALLGEAAAARRKLVFATNGDPPWPIRQRAYSWEIGEFAAEDYARICASLRGKSRVDFTRVHRFAPALSARQLWNACEWLRHEPDVDTDVFIEYLRSRDLTSNVELDEVQRVAWSDLKGVSDVIQELEAKIALPFENHALREELKLQPKRGVLLAGPPGTGKTTIGRALAHRLKSKFFLIDGTVVAGSCDFQEQVEKVFEAAKKNAPSIVFIDDADVIFESSEQQGFYRYLLTMLDGLESASAGRVCVILTAMHAGSLPQAMLRSGRVELWLETRLPDEDARAAILSDKLSELPPPIGAADISRIASSSSGLTGADLKSVVDDAKLLFAHDRAQGKEPRPAEEYFLMAIESVRNNRRKYGRSRPPRLGESVRFGFSVA